MDDYCYESDERDHHFSMLEKFKKTRGERGLMGRRETGPGDSLTGKQQLVLQYIQFRTESGCPPTLKEIGLMCLPSATSPTSSARHQVDALVKKGRLSPANGEDRGLRPIEREGEK